MHASSRGCLGWANVVVALLAAAPSAQAFRPGALGWLFNGLLFLSLVPLVVGPLISWYISSNLIEGACPECGAPVQVLKGQSGTCFSCGSSFSDDRDASTGVFTRQGAASSSWFGEGGASEDGVVEVDVIVDDD
ncbi:hypothetical protein EMIHUDRAFT_220681 [Emiliania huxleyi CCMP1516]|nr:hypothetical protein EMIHUDRAFT_220681 [Emiliania huxleyi CCMP1516]EOD04881.1 hypothetical protein EMIHUDRAFT_220681 [Emiliania huxleyi CCMP1516]|eukprot:XP_005757310.1 hypothetical protein EMIHUDRAFT_220681 [Emiliania huxleyi CCMP1516]